MKYIFILLTLADFLDIVVSRFCFLISALHLGFDKQQALNMMIMLLFSLKCSVCWFDTKPLIKTDTVSVKLKHKMNVLHSDS